MTAERAGSQAHASGRGSRRKHSTQYKLEVVRELLKPGVSAREVARRHGLHESLVGAWRRRYSQGRLQDAQRAVSQARLLPVQVPLETQDRASAVEASLAPRAIVPGTIHIEFSHGHRLSVRGQVDANALSAVIRELSRS